jgi:hypothetical protein
MTAANRRHPAGEAISPGVGVRSAIVVRSRSVHAAGSSARAPSVVRHRMHNSASR